MDQRYGCLCCMEALAIIRIKMVVSVVQSMNLFFSCEVKHQLLVLCPYRHVTFLKKRLLKTTHILAAPTEARWIGWNMTELTCQKNCGRQNRFAFMTRLYKTFENIDREWNYGNVYGRSCNESKYFSFNSTVAQLGSGLS